MCTMGQAGARRIIRLEGEKASYGSRDALNRADMSHMHAAPPSRANFAALTAILAAAFILAACGKPGALAEGPAPASSGWPIP